MTADDIDRALGDAERLLFDSSALIAFHNPNEATHAVADHLLRRVERETDPVRGYISVVSVSELLIRPLRTSRADFTFMHDFLTSYPNLTILPMDVVLAVQTATLRASMRLSLPDAVVVAAGMLAGCDAIVSDDARWAARGAPLFPQFRWIYLADYLSTLTAGCGRLEAERASVPSSRQTRRGGCLWSRN
jgi:predicted nucleic acid-binding protein